MEVIIEKCTDEILMRKACETTINAESKMTLEKIYFCEHSPMRTQIFWVRLNDIPTFVSTHLVRHKIDVEHYVKSNREDRPAYSGEGGGRWHSVNHGMRISAQSLVNLARKRLCAQSHMATRKVMLAIVESMKDVDPALAEKLVPDCIYRGGCFELRPCGFMPRSNAYDIFKDKREKFFDEIKKN